MNLFPMNSSVKVWLATGHTDMRCGFPTLALRVQEILKLVYLMVTPYLEVLQIWLLIKIIHNLNKENVFRISFSP